MVDRKRLEQERVHQAEDGRVGANSKRQREHRCYGKAGRAAQLTKRKSKILNQGPHLSLRAYVWNKFLEMHVSGQTESSVSGVLSGQLRAEAGRGSTHLVRIWKSLSETGQRRCGAF